MTATVKANRITRKQCSSVRRSTFRRADPHFCRNPEHERRTEIPVSLNFQEALRPDFWIICGAQRSKSATPLPMWKRFQDIICILLSLPILLPIMLTIVVWIRLVSSGPALFRQERIGVNGTRFILYKFRSMKMNCGTIRHEKHFENLVLTKTQMTKLDLLSDSRLISGGYLLRAAGLDELPQLFNVLKGEMSLVGPRPCLPAEYNYFSPSHRKRFQALPGLTGMWQVSGKNESTFEEMNMLDTEYVRTVSPILDLEIMMRTPWALFRQVCHASQRRRSTQKRTMALKPKRSSNME